MTDRTAQLERRLGAIRILPDDCCAFYERREKALFTRRECWYCAHGNFEKDTDNPHQPGFCGFKK